MHSGNYGYNYKSVVGTGNTVTLTLTRSVTSSMFGGDMDEIAVLIQQHDTDVLHIKVTFNVLNLVYVYW